MKYQKITTHKEYEELCDEIWLHNRLYFQQAAPIISDVEYDILLKMLEESEIEHPEWISSTSPTKKVGEAPLEDFPEVQHTTPMLSLEKAFTCDELESFYTRLSKLIDTKDPILFAQPKMDGLAISVLYENGHFIRAVTRGNGVVGSDISTNCKTIPGLPLRIEPRFTRLEVRGEVFMLKERFDAINAEREKEGLSLFANPRNAAAGSLKLLDSKKLAERSGLEIIFYGISEQSPIVALYQSDVETILSQIGLPTFSNTSYITRPLTQKIYSLKEMMEFQAVLHHERANLPFQIDGVVFKLNSLDEANSISSTSKHPRSAIAWKFGAEQTWTTLNSITVQVGRTGVITPVAELFPVELDGSIVKRATLHNSDEIERKDIRIHDRVLIEKSGDIIPRVIMSDKTVVTRGDPWVFPTTCPSCNTLLIRDQDGVSIRCPNRGGCSEQRVKEIIHFSGKSGLDIEHVGEKLVRHLYSQGYISSFSDLFTLTVHDLITLEGIQDKSAKNIIESIKKSKNPDLDTFIMALGIRHVGKNAAQALAKALKKIDSILTINKEELLLIEGFGIKIIESIISLRSDPIFYSELQKLRDVGVYPKEIEERDDILIKNHPLYKKKFALTGTLQRMSRTEAITALQRVGAVHTNSVTKKTSYVIVGDSPGSKKEKAMMLQIPILDEEQFIAILK